MNSTLCVLNDTIFDDALFKQEDVVPTNTYVTASIPAFKILTSQRSAEEEELHTLFEEAISERVFTLHSRLNRLSNPVVTIQGAEPNTDTILSITSSTRNTTVAQKLVQITTHSLDSLEDALYPSASSRRAIALVCFAVMFLLLGFDIMGFLVLHMH